MLVVKFCRKFQTSYDLNMLQVITLLIYKFILIRIRFVVVFGVRFKQRLRQIFYDYNIFWSTKVSVNFLFAFIAISKNKVPAKLFVL